MLKVSRGKLRGGEGLAGNGPHSTRVIRLVQSWISEGHLGEGDFVPSERVLAARCGVARGTARVALDEMEKEGLIVRLGSRRRVAAGPQVEPTVMDDTVGILTLDPEQLVMPQASEGWERFVEVGAAEAISTAGMHVLGLYPDRMTDATLERLLRHSPVGLVAGGNAQRSADGRRIMAQLAKAGTTVVAYGDGPEQAPYDRVCSDHQAGTCELTRWLVRQRGRQRILRLWGKGAGDYPYWLANRDRGYEQAMADAGLAPLPPLVFDAPTDNLEGFELLTRAIAGYLLEHVRGNARIDAILAITDGVVQAVAAACRLHGLEPNVDVDIAGYDNFWSQSAERKFGTLAPVATVDKHNRQIGHQMVNLLRQRLAGQLPPEPQRVVIPPSLVVVDGNAN